MGNLCGKKEKKKWAKGYPEVFINEEASNHPAHFPSNYLSTTKYTWWNFLFKNIILEQFRCVAGTWLA